MNEKEFLSQLDEILNSEGEITMDSKLDEIEEWDSLSALMFQSFVFKQTKEAPKPSELKAAKTIADLYEFVKSK